MTEPQGKRADVINTLAPKPAPASKGAGLGRAANKSDSKKPDRLEKHEHDQMSKTWPLNITWVYSSGDQNGGDFSHVIHPLLSAN